MDFVISKVGLSICALLMLSMLGQAFEEPLLITERRNLDAIADQIDDIVYTLAEKGCEAEHVYCVPSLATGSPITLIVRCYGVEITSENARSVVASSCPLHLWELDCAEMNQSEVEERDSSCEPLVAVSGDPLTISVKQMSIQGVNTAMIFISSADKDAAIAS